jgi:type II secretory pathway pseudopilin PulG
MVTRERGVTYLALLLAIALVSSVLAASATVWSQVQRHEREKQLLWAGDQFRRALAAYSRSGNGTYPRTLEDLLDDRRGPARRRHLRQIYEDPMTRGSDWGLIRNPQGGIIGVYSRYAGVPVKTANFPPQYDSFEHARSYADWKFAAAKPIPTEEPPAGQTAGQAAAQPASQPVAQPAADSADRAAKSTPMAIPRAAVIDSGQNRSNVFAPSPLTPLQNLQSPFSPGSVSPPPSAAAPPAAATPTETPPPARTSSSTEAPSAPASTTPASTTPASTTPASTTPAAATGGSAAPSRQP